MTKKQWEASYPLVGACAIAIVSVAFPFDPRSKGALLASAVTVVTVTVGFLAAIATILLTIRSKALEFMKRVGKFGGVLDFIWASARWSAVFLLASAIVYFLPDKISGWYGRGLSGIWSFLGTLALLMIYRAMDISLMLLASAAHQMEGQPPKDETDK